MNPHPVQRKSAQIEPTSCLLYVHMSIPTYIAYNWFGFPLNANAERFLEHLLSYVMLKYPFKSVTSCNNNNNPHPTDNGGSADSVARVVLNVYNKRHDTGGVADFILMRQMSHKCMFTGSQEDVKAFEMLNADFKRLFRLKSLKVVNDIQAKISANPKSRAHISWEMFLSACVIDILLEHGIDHYVIMEMIDKRIFSGFFGLAHGMMSSLSSGM